MDDQTTSNELTTDTPSALPANPPESAPTAVDLVSGQSEGSDTVDMPPEPPKSPIDAPSTSPVEDQNSGINQSESDEPKTPESAPNEPQSSSDDQQVPAADESTTEPENLPESEPTQPAPTQPISVQQSIQSTTVQSAPDSAPTPQTPTAPHTQPSTQQDEVGFIRSLLNKANAKLLSNRQKKLNKIIQFAQEKKIIKNDDIQKLLRVSDTTSTRYLVKLVQQGHLIRVGLLRDAKYQFVE